MGANRDDHRPAGPPSLTSARWIDDRDVIEATPDLGRVGHTCGRETTHGDDNRRPVRAVIAESNRKVGRIYLVGHFSPRVSPEHSMTTGTVKATAHVASPSEEDHRERLRMNEHDARASLWWPTCDDAPRGGRGCGLLTDRLTDEWIGRFVREGCNEDPAEDLSEDCRVALRRKVLDAIRRRYTRANERDVHVACANDPERCERFDRLELLFLMSHNAVVLSTAERRAGELVAEHERAQSAARRAREAQAREADEQRRIITALTTGIQVAAVVATRGGGSSASPTDAGRECSNDHDCEFGHICSKPANRYRGVCATAVDQHGIERFTPARSDSWGPGKRQCRIASDCGGFGFECNEGRCLKPK
jgi:hypothetical protein